MKNIEFEKKFLDVFSIHIYSEDRYFNEKEHLQHTLYKNFVTVKLLNFRIFHTFWRTGKTCVGNVAFSSFYIKN